jgi:hypothetical protein
LAKRVRAIYEAEEAEHQEQRMHEDQLVELVAMAIARVYSPRKGQKTWRWPDVPEGARDNMGSDARAAIAA